MAVQEFLIDEVVNLTTDTDDLQEWQNKVEELDLEGQRKIQSGDKRTPVPFPLMNQAMKNTYGVLCPSILLIHDYDKTAIPLRVLALLSLCKENEYFGKIEIWFDDKTPCPLAVGCDGSDKYIIARWGDELEEFAVLQERAIIRKEGLRRIRLKKDLKEAQFGLNTLAEDARSYVMGETSYLY